MTGAMACHAVLEGTAGDFAAYAADLARVSRAYDHNLALAYAAESRWPENAFWARRTRRAAVGGAMEERRVRR